MDLWFKKDNKFVKPKGLIGLKVYTHDLDFGLSPVARVFGELWNKCLNEYVREFCYMADCADLSFSWNLCTDSVDFEWSGYSDSLPTYIKETLQKIQTMKSIDLEKFFGLAKEQLLQEMKNFYVKQTYKIAS